MTRALWLALLAAGCDGVFTHPGSRPADGPVELDAPADAALASHHYVMSGQRFTDLDKQAIGLDLDGDELVDNQLGGMLSVLAQQGFEPNAAAADAIQHGRVLVLPALWTDSFEDGPAQFTLYTGASASPAPCDDVGKECGKHLQGDATITLSSTPRDAPLSGTFVDGRMLGAIAATPSDAQLELGISFYETPVTLRLAAARVQLDTVGDGGIMHGVIAGGVRVADVDNDILRELAIALDAVVDRDCTGPRTWPDCGCSAQSTGRSLLQGFDEDASCSLGTTDLQHNSTVSQLLAPDLALDAEPLVSFGVEFTAVSATYTP